MLALSDNDVVCKLVACGIFDDALGVLGCTRADVRILLGSRYSIGHRAKPGNKHRRSVIATYGEATTRAIGDLLESLEVVPAPSTATDDLLVGVELDAGELQLLRVAYERRAAIVATNDKRALRALIDDASCRPVRDAVAGRVVTFDRLLLGLLNRHGFAWVVERISGVAHADGVLRLAFSRGTATPEAHVRDCLESYSAPFDELLIRLPACAEAL